MHDSDPFFLPPTDLLPTDPLPVDPDAPYLLTVSPPGDPRFGPILYQLHSLFLRAGPLQSRFSWWLYTSVPLYIVFAQAYILVGGKKGTRPIRAALAAAYVSLTLYNVMTYRIVGEYLFLVAVGHEDVGVVVGLYGDLQIRNKPTATP